MNTRLLKLISHKKRNTPMRKTTLKIIMAVLLLFSCFAAGALQPVEKREELSALLNKAYSMMRSGNYSIAAEHFETYLNVKPDNALIHLEVAYVYQKLGQDSSALNHFLEYKELKGDSIKPIVLLDLAYLYLRVKKDELAQQYLIKYLEIKPEQIAVQSDLAFIQLRLGNKKEAIKRMRLILKQDPKRETIRLNLAYLLMPTEPKKAVAHFRILKNSRNPKTQQLARVELSKTPSRFGYFIYSALYHSFRFNINVMDINSRVYLRKSFISPIEPYLFLMVSTDAESRVNPFPSIYSEQAAIAGAGLQWYFIKRNARLYVQYGYRKLFLDLPELSNENWTLSFGMDSFFYIPLSKKWGLEFNNTLAYHSRFKKDTLFEGRELLTYYINTPSFGNFTAYTGVMGRWDSKKYFYNNNYELLAGLRWSWRKDYRYFFFAEYKWGDYTKETVYGRHYNECIAGFIIGIYH